MEIEIFYHTSNKFFLLMNISSFTSDNISSILKTVNVFYKQFLPPANEVWGKVIFSQACVKNSVHGGGVSAPGGVCSQGVSAPEGGAWWRPPPGTAAAAGGTHPTGMHFCLKKNQFIFACMFNFWSDFFVFWKKFFLVFI